MVLWPAAARATACAVTANNAAAPSASAPVARLAAAGFAAGAVVGLLGGQVRLGGAEFRVPVNGSGAGGLQILRSGGGQRLVPPARELVARVAHPLLPAGGRASVVQPAVLPSQSPGGTTGRLPEEAPASLTTPHS